MVMTKICDAQYIERNLQDIVSMQCCVKMLRNKILTIESRYIHAQGYDNYVYVIGNYV